MASPEGGRETTSPFVEGKYTFELLLLQYSISLTGEDGSLMKIKRK